MGDNPVMNRKERIKNVVLALLIVLSLVLSGKIWFSADLWPEGYTFITSAKEFVGSIFNSDSNFDSDCIIYPEKLIAFSLMDRDHIALELDKAPSVPSPVKVYVQQIISDALYESKMSSYISVSESDWQKAMNSNGFYVDYKNVFSPSEFASLISINIPDNVSAMLSSIREFVITGDSSGVFVYIRDSAKNTYYKLRTEADKKDFSSILSENLSEASAKNRFAYYIGADKPTNDGMGEVLFYPYMLLREEETEYPCLISSNPLSEEDFSLSDGSNALLSAFSVNPKTVKKYTDAESNTVFVQNRASIKISADGYLSYSVVSGKNGLLISESQKRSDVMMRLGKLVSKVSLVFGDIAPLQLSEVSEGSDGFTVYYDYVVGGIPIEFKSSHAVSIKITNGRLTEYSQILRSYEISDKKIKVSSTYKAVDNILNAVSEGEGSVITDMTVKYADNEQLGEKVPSWYLKANGSSDNKTVQE